MNFDHMEEKLNFKDSLKNLLNTEEEFKGMLEWKARAQWHYFFQLVDRGFTEEQAIELTSKLFKSI